VQGTGFCSQAEATHFSPSAVAFAQQHPKKQRHRLEPMTNLERFNLTINWEIPDRLMTYDLVDNRDLFET